MAGDRRPGQERKTPENCLQAKNPLRIAQIFPQSRAPAQSAENSVRPPEVDGYIRLHFYSVSVENIRPISPLFHRIHGGHDQQRMTADQTQALNGAVAADDRM